MSHLYDKKSCISPLTNSHESVTNLSPSVNQHYVICFSAHVKNIMRRALV